MKFKNLLGGMVLFLLTLGFNSSHAEKSTMETFFYQGLVLTKKNVFLVKNPIRVRIRISNKPEEIQKLHRVDLHIIYENPAASGEVGTWNTRLTHRDLGIFSEGQQIRRGAWVPREPKPWPPLNDSHFIQLKPGEQRTMDWEINLNDLAMVEGKHQYELFLAGSHVLVSEEEKISKAMPLDEKKFILSDGTQSNTVMFTYTKQPKVPSDP